MKRFLVNIVSIQQKPDGALNINSALNDCIFANSKEEAIGKYYEWWKDLDCNKGREVHLIQSKEINLDTDK